MDDSTSPAPTPAQAPRTEVRYEIGAVATGTDGELGKVTRLVVDPVRIAVTHLVVEPPHRAGLGKLVPLDLVEGADPDAGAGIRLRCGEAAFGELPAAEEEHFLPGSNGGYGGYGFGQVLAWPNFSVSSFGVAGGTPLDAFDPVVTDAVPAGQVAIHRGDPVGASDGDVGRVMGLGIDPGSGRVTHVLLQEGHLWGRKEVGIPVDLVTRVGDRIHVDLTTDEIGDLPPIGVGGAEG